MKQSKRKVIFEILSIAIGIISYLIVYGYKILDIANVDWIKSAGGDLTQSYYGWLFFKNSDWHWPIGLMAGVAPDLTSIIYIDSVPLFNVLFKLFKGILPTECQFFGIWGLVCFILSGWLGYKLIYMCTRNEDYSLLGSIFFIFNNFMIQRLFTHTALAANWVILLGLIIVRNHNMSDRCRYLSWGSVFFLCVSINIYYIPILGIFMLMECLYQVMVIKNWKVAVKILCASLSFTFFTFYLYGGMYKLNAGDASPSGLGYYCANLNSLINPMETGLYLSGFGKILKTKPMATDGQYEGYAYLGAGLLLLGIFLIAGILYGGKEGFKDYWKKYKWYAIFGIITVVILQTLSMGTIFSYNSKILFNIPYPEFLKNILAIFRSTGRFLWGAWDIYAVVVIVCIFKQYKKVSSISLLALCLILQLYDISDLILDRHIRFSGEQSEYVSSLSNSAWDEAMNGKKQFFTYNHQVLRLSLLYDIADIALNHDASINDFYYSRRNNESINDYKNIEWNNLCNGNPDEKKLYFFDTLDDAKRVCQFLHVYILDNEIIGSVNEIADLQELVQFEFEGVESNWVQMDENYIGLNNKLPQGDYWIEVKGNGLGIVKAYDGEDETPLEIKYDGGGLASGKIHVQIGSKIVIEKNGDIESIKIYKLK